MTAVRGPVAAFDASALLEVRGQRGGLVQPAVKCRGREYLRIIYGPEYSASEHLCSRSNARVPWSGARVRLRAVARS